MVRAPLPPSAYDELGPAYDRWCRSVTEDIDFYVGLAIASGGPVLELGVGSGRIALPTLAAGIAVVGVDTSPVMLEITRRRAPPLVADLRLVEADMRDLPDLGRFPLVTIPFRALLHLRDDTERLAVLQGARRSLLPGARLAFDVFHPDTADVEETNDRWLEREPGVFERARWRPDERSLTLDVRAEGTEASMELWWAEPDDWRRLLGEAGFEAVEQFSWFDRRPPEPGATDSVWVATAAAAGAVEPG